MKKLMLLILSASLLLSGMPFAAYASSGDTMSMIIDALREGSVSEVRQYNQQLPEYEEEEACVSSMSQRMKAAYKKEISKWENKKEYDSDFGNYMFYDYWLTDLDNDGTAELLLALWPSHAGALTYAYKYENGTLKNLGFIGGQEYCSAYPGHNGVILEHCYMGYDSFTLVTLQNGKINKESLNMFEFDAGEDYINLGNELKSHNKYSNGRYVPDYDVLDGGVPEYAHMDLEFNSADDISFDWGTDLLKKDASAQNSFNLNLAKAAIYLSEGTYHGQDEMENRMKTLGFTNPKSEYYKIDAQTNTSPITVASDVAEIDGTEYLLIGVAVRGTQDDGWDFITDIRSGALNVDGFAEAGETGMAVVKEYYDKVSSETGIDKNHTIIFVTGHSLGAAIAGQIAGNLQDDIALQRHIFAYTFASPYYETHGKDIGSFTNIHNIVNTEDAVPKFPLGGVRYGIDHTFTGDGSDMLDQHMLGTYLRALKLASPPKTVITQTSHKE